MDNLSFIEEYYQKFMQDLSQWLPDGVVEVDLDLLHKMDLLKYFYGEGESEETLTRHFHVIESLDKITLINSQFIIWVVPDQVDGIPRTLTLIALNKPMEPELSLAFAACGVYNTSGLVLRILEKLLFEIQETEDLIGRYASAA
jgi:hypothetical protein